MFRDVNSPPRQRPGDDSQSTENFAAQTMQSTQNLAAQTMQLLNERRESSRRSRLGMSDQITSATSQAGTPASTPEAITPVARRLLGGSANLVTNSPAKQQSVPSGIVEAVMGSNSLLDAGARIASIYVLGDLTLQQNKHLTLQQNKQDNRRLTTTTNTFNLKYLNPVNYIPGINYLRPAAKTATDVFKTWAVPAGERVQKEVQTFGLPTGIFFLLLLLSSLVYAYTLTMIKNMVYMWILKGITMSLAAILPTFVFRWKPRYVCGFIIAVAFMIQGMKDDTFVNSRLPERMNQHFYQKVDALASTKDPDLSVLSALFAGRKAITTCRKRYNNPSTCEADLNELKRVHDILFDAIMNVLKTPEITTPRDVILRLKVDGEFMNSNIETIDFKETLERIPPSETDLVARDFYESHVYALAASRLMDGKYYYERYGQWLKAQQTSHGILDQMQWVASMSGIFETMLFGPAGGIKFAHFKIWITSLNWLYQWIFPDQTTVEFFVKFIDTDATVVRKNNVLDFCIPGRCHQRNSYASRHIISILNSTTDPLVQKCPLAHMDDVMNFNECPALQELCVKAIDKYSNELNPSCPSHCGKTIFLDEFQNKKRDEDFVKKGGFTCVHTDDPKSARVLEKQCESMWCHAEKTAKNLVGTATSFASGGITLLLGGYVNMQRV